MLYFVQMLVAPSLLEVVTFYKNGGFGRSLAQGTPMFAKNTILEVEKENI